MSSCPPNNSSGVHDGRGVAQHRTDRLDLHQDLRISQMRAIPRQQELYVMNGRHGDIGPPTLFPWSLRSTNCTF